MISTAVSRVRKSGDKQSSGNTRPSNPAANTTPGPRRPISSPSTTIPIGRNKSRQSRIKATADFVAARVKVGNLYVNRNQIGAVVGVQPFGGVGLSGTGPKAGGPHYLARFATEQTVTVNTAAAGGNASLLGGRE